MGRPGRGVGLRFKIEGGDSFEEGGAAHRAGRVGRGFHIFFWRPNFPHSCFWRVRFYQA